MAENSCGVVVLVGSGQIFRIKLGASTSFLSDGEWCEGRLKSKSCLRGIMVWGLFEKFLNQS